MPSCCAGVMRRRCAPPTRFGRDRAGRRSNSCGPKQSSTSRVWNALSPRSPPSSRRCQSDLRGPATWPRVMGRTVPDVGTALAGRSLGLVTSGAPLRGTCPALREPRGAQGIQLLAQGIDESSRTRLLEAFRRGSRMVLFGTNAFWEGIDVVGDALSCVMVTRLPFAVPTDPVYAARAEQFDEPFSQFAVPQAVLRLKQGFGRLIRSRADR